jgi:hypothetical protein
MKADDLDLERWDLLKEDERSSLARQVAGQLPAAFVFVGIRCYKLGEQQHHVALFDYQGSRFALIPGGAVPLGYDPEQAFRPTPQQLASWQNTAAEYEIGCTLHEYIREASTSVRTITLKPFLLEVESREVGVEPIEGGLASYPVVYRVTWQSQRQVAECLAREGFRLPSSDEWEHACRAGSRTLFRWGDFCPADCYPEGSGERIAFDLHQRPNAFGLHIAENPYGWEFVTEPDMMRGGDGGCTICGGGGFFVGWLTLASSYVDSAAGRHYQGRAVPGAHMRRLYPLP